MIVKSNDDLRQEAFAMQVGRYSPYSGGTHAPAVLMRTHGVLTSGRCSCAPSRVIRRRLHRCMLSCCVGGAGLHRRLTRCIVRAMQSRGLWPAGQPPGGFQLIRLFQRIFRLDHSPLWLETYRILPISSDRGARARARVRACTCVCV